VTGLGCIAALVPPLRTHRHCYFGVLAPNSPLQATAQAEPGVVPLGNALTTQPEPANPVPPKRPPAHYLWALLITRIYEIFPLLCPMCGGQMRIIVFITHSADIRHILKQIAAESELPHIAPARGPPLWEECDAQAGEASQVEPDWGLVAQPAPDYEVDQHVNRRVRETAIALRCRVRLHARQMRRGFLAAGSAIDHAGCSNCIGQRRFEAQKSCHAWLHAVEFLYA
jgi:hypothetical protein